MREQSKRATTSTSVLRSSGDVNGTEHCAAYASSPSSTGSSRPTGWKTSSRREWFVCAKATRSSHTAVMHVPLKGTLVSGCSEPSSVR